MDIAPSYDEWVRLGFALADTLGERGREYYQRLSAIHIGCTPTAADKQYTNCLRSSGSGITINTFFHMAKEGGIPLNHAPADLRICGSSTNYTVNNNHIEEETRKNATPHDEEVQIYNPWILAEDELPTFSEDVYKHLPSFIEGIVDNAISPSDREVLLMGALTVLSATMNNVHGVYDERITYPNLYLFVVAEAGIGKGALTLCRELVSPINIELRDIVKRQKENLENNKDVNIPMLTLIIPANSSASAFIKTLAENNGRGLMFETEGDTLSQTLKTDYGNFSDVLRNAFHHDPVSINRRKDREFLEVEHPKLSVALAGTPEQVRNLIPNSENGLFSRFMFYNMKFERSIRNVFAITDPKSSKTEVFRGFGRHYKELWGRLYREAETYEISIPPLLQATFIDQYKRLNDDGCVILGNKMQAVVRRNGLIAFRIMMVLTVIRHLTEGVYSPTQMGESLRLECCEEDFSTALSIAETLLYHSAYVLRKLDRDNKTSSLSDRQQRLYDALPDNFTTKEYDEVAKQMGFVDRTCERWRATFIASNLLIRNAHGHYEKVRQQRPIPHRRPTRD